jgi:hypothetical protein
MKLNFFEGGNTMAESIDALIAKQKVIQQKIRAKKAAQEHENQQKLIKAIGELYKR